MVLRKKKIVALVPVKNEAVRIEFFLRSISVFCDAICLYDDQSDDNTIEIVERLSKACKVESVIQNHQSEWRFDESQFRQQLLVEGRKIGGTHFITLDADEAFTANLAKDSELRKMILFLEPGDTLQMTWIQLWRSVSRYRHDDSVWTNNYKTFVFADDGVCNFHSQSLHLVRNPSNLKGKVYRLGGYDAGVMHFQFVNWQNLLVKQAWYRCLERVQNPEKSVEEINRLYAPSKDERGLTVRAVPDNWFEGYDFFDSTFLETPEIWRKKMVQQWFKQYGRDYFAGLDVWDINWDKTDVKEKTQMKNIAKPVGSNLFAVKKGGLPENSINLPRISAIVSTYNSERYLRGCLEDLESQTVADQLEIIVVNSGSRQNEEEIVREFQERYTNIKYIKTEHRESVYQAWNRAIRIATGKYITNANTDDRHRKDALEVMAGVLDLLKEIALVYGDLLITENENETFENCTPSGSFHWKDFDRKHLLNGKCIVGPQPMWRRSVHEDYGFFDESFITSGDFEFWLRISQTHKFLHLPVELGLYLRSPNSIEHRNRNRQPIENEKSIRFYQGHEKDVEFVRQRYHLAMYEEGKSYADTHNEAQPNANEIKQIVSRVALHQKREEFDEGAKLLAKAIHNFPAAQNLREKFCELLIDAEQFDDAIQLLMKIGDGDWKIRTFELMAMVREKTGEYDDLTEMLERATSLGYRSAILYHLQGVVAYHANAVDKAIEWLKESIQLDPEQGPAYIHFGLILIEKGDIGGGMELLSTGFSKTPCDPAVSEAYHSVISEMGDYRHAETLFREAVEQDPECKKLNYLYTDILLQQRKYDQALSVIQCAIATFGIADGILQPAIAIRNKIDKPRLEFEPDANRISLCMIVKDEEEDLPKALWSSAGLVDEIVIVDTGSLDRTKEIAHVFGADVYDSPWNDNFSEARNVSLARAKGNWIFVLDADERISLSDHSAIKRLVADSKDNHVAFSFTTRNYVNDVGVEGWQVNQGNYREERGLGWYPSVKVRLFPNRQFIRFENRVHEKVEKSLNRGHVKVVPLGIPIHHVGELSVVQAVEKKGEYYQLGQEKLFETENDIESLIEHAIQAGETGDFHRAVELWKVVLKRNPDYAKGFFNLGYVYIQQGQYKLAKRVSEKAMELDPDLKEAALNLSLCEMRIGNVRKAIQILEGFLTRYPDHPMALGSLGVAYCIHGRQNAGTSYLKQVWNMGFNGRDFIDGHVRGLNAAGQPDLASALLAAMTNTSFLVDTAPVAT